MQDFDAQVGRMRDLTRDVREVELRLVEPREIAFAAGQFVSFQVAAPDRRIPLTRPYSIVSSPRERSAIELLFNLVPGGPGSSFLYSLRPSDRVRFRGPAGTFVLRDDGSRDLLLVATGTGIAPVRSIILSRLEEDRPGRVQLVWGLRSEEDLYYADEFRALAAAHDHFEPIITLSQPSPAWTGPSGRVQHIVEDRVRSTDGLAVYACGNSSMIKTVTALIRQIGPCPIYREQYYRDDDRPPGDA